MQSGLTVQEADEQRKAATEHRDAVLAMAAVLVTPHGKTLFKFLFKHLEVAETIPYGVTDEHIREFIGIQRAGKRIFKLASEADADIAGRILADVERERYAKLISENS